ncbi:MAG: ankyrin repeat domain-containing protein [Akkermansiaceae bacterium]|nr:ankyrin repeat domain-containing protein [Akkermansiaceae bacterium]
MNARFNLTQTVLEALLFFHPAMWWVSRQVRKERENCCDDIAVAVSGNRECYVQALTRLEEQRAASSVAALAATGGSLLDRARRLLGQPCTEFGYRSAAAWLAGLAAVGSVSLALATGDAPQKEDGEVSADEVEDREAVPDPIEHEAVLVVREFFKAVEGGDYDRVVGLATSGKVKREGLVELGKAFDWGKADIDEALVSGGNAAVLTQRLPASEAAKPGQFGFHLVNDRDRWLIRDGDFLPDAEAAKKWLADFRRLEPDARPAKEDPPAADERPDREVMLAYARALAAGDFAVLGQFWEFQDDLERQFAEKVATMCARAEKMSVELVSMKRLDEDSLFACFLVCDGPELCADDKGPQPNPVVFKRKEGRWRGAFPGSARNVVEARTMGLEQRGRRIVTRNYIQSRFGPRKPQRSEAYARAQAEAFARLAGPEFNLTQFGAAAEQLRERAGGEEPKICALGDRPEDGVPRPDDFYLSFYLAADPGDPEALKLPFPGPEKTFLAEPFPCLTDDAVREARVGRGSEGDRVVVEIDFTAGGAKLFEAITRESIKKRLAIMVGGKVISAPQIMVAIDTGKVWIEGDFTREEAEAIAEKLNSFRKEASELLEEVGKGPDGGDEGAGVEKADGQAPVNRIVQELMGLRYKHPELVRLAEDVRHEVNFRNGAFLVSMVYEHNYNGGTKTTPAGPKVAGQPWCRIGLDIRPADAEPAQMKASPVDGGPAIRWNGNSDFRNYRFADPPLVVAVTVESGSDALRGEANRIIDRELNAFRKEAAKSNAGLVGEGGGVGDGPRLSIIDTSGKPVAGARVRFDKHVLVKENGRSRGTYVVVGETVSDGDGKAAIPGPADPEIKRLIVRVEAEGRVSRWFHHDCEIRRNAEGEWDEEPVVLLKGGIVTGRVFGPDGEPLAGAPLSMTTRCDYGACWRGDGEAPHGGSWMTANHLRAISDANGVYRFDGVPAGEVFFYYPWEGPTQGEVDSGKWQAWTKPGQDYPQPPVTDRGWVQALQFAEGERREGVDVDLSKSTASVEGQVVDSAGQAVGGAKVRATWNIEGINRHSLPDSFQGGHATTGPDGGFRLTGLPPGVVVLAVSHETLKPPRQPVEVRLMVAETSRNKVIMSGRQERGAGPDPAKKPLPPEFSGVTAITFHNDLGGDRFVKVTKPDEVRELIAAIELTPKEPCLCEHMWSATFLKKGRETKVALCDHCFEFQGDRPAKHFQMPPGFFRLFAKHTGWPAELKQDAAPGKAGDESARPGGKPGKDVQVRLHSPQAQWDDGRWTLFFKTDLDSETERVMPYYGAPIEEFFLEVDGEWFDQKDRGAVVARSVAPSPASQRRDLHTRICAREWRSMSTGLPMPEFAPGRHTVRIGFPLADEPDASGQRPRAVSNPVEIVTATKEVGETSIELRKCLTKIVKRIGELKGRYRELEELDDVRLGGSIAANPDNPLHLGFEYSHRFDGWDKNKQPEMGDGGCLIAVRFGSPDNPSSMMRDVSLPRFGKLVARYLVLDSRGEGGPAGIFYQAVAAVIAEELEKLRDGGPEEVKIIDSEEQSAVEHSEYTFFVAKVVDADTGELIEKPTALAGTNRMEPLGWQWQPHTIHEFTKGRMQWPSESRRGYKMQVLRIEADGYKPYQTPTVQRLEEDEATLPVGATTGPNGEAIPNMLQGRAGEPVPWVVRLQRDPGVHGRALLPNGQPAAGAQVAIAMAAREVRIEDGRITAPPLDENASLRDHWDRPFMTTTDDQGRFTLPTEIAPAAVIITHAEGIAAIPLADFPISGEMTLEPWGVIDGRVQWGEVSGAGAKIDIGARTRVAEQFQLVVWHHQSVVTDDQGRFRAEKLPPGLAQVSHVVEVPGKQGASYRPVQFVEIVAGEPTKFVFGGLGRPVIGRLVGRNNYEHLKLGIAPEAPYAGLLSEPDDAGWEAYSIFVNSPAGKHYVKSGIRMNADGTFRIENVPPENYQLFVSAPNEGNIGNAKFTIKTIPGGESDRAQDLGEIGLAPVEIEVAAAQGKRLVTDIPEEPLVVGNPQEVTGVPGLLPAPMEAPTFLVPEKTRLLSRGKKVTSSSKFPITGDLDQVTDGKKRFDEGLFVELEPGSQWVQIDLGQSVLVDAVWVWHHYQRPRWYHDVVIQVSDDPEFKIGVTTIYNNDRDNSSRLGIGRDRPYVESRFGLLVDGRGVSGRHVRLHSRGNNYNDLNYYTEVEVFGRDFIDKARENDHASRDEARKPKGPGADLAPGISVEVLAVADIPANGRWWDADGNVVEKIFWDDTAVVHEPTKNNRQVILRLNSTESDPELKPTMNLSVHRKSAGVGSWVGGGFVNKGNRTLEDLSRCRFSLHDDHPTVDISATVGYGPWQTLATRDAASQGDLTSVMTNAGTVIFNDPVSRDGKTTITLTLLAQLETARLIAVDKKGKTHVCGTMVSGGFSADAPRNSPAHQLYKGEVSLPLSAIDQFHFQTRCTKKTSLKNIALHPGGASKSRSEATDRAIGNGTDDDSAIPKQPALPKMVPVTSNELGVTFDRPAEWIVDKEPPPHNGPGVDFAQPLTMVDDVRASLSVSMEEAGGRAGIDVTSPGNPNATARRIFEVDGEPARLTVLKVNGRNYELLRVAVARGMRFYEINMGFPQKRHDEYVRLALAICESLRFHKWGEPVESVQCRLMEERPIWTAGESPRFTVIPRTSGDSDLLLASAIFFGCRVEIDGKWNQWSGDQKFVGQAYSSARMLERRKHSLSISLDASSLTAIEGKERLKWTEGKHTVRFAWAAYPPDETPVSNAEPPLRLISNPVEIEIVPAVIERGDGKVSGRDRESEELTGLPRGEFMKRLGRSLISNGNLHTAAREGDAATVARLLERGADPDKRNWRNATPLHEAALHGHLPVVKLLVEHGADVNRRGDTYQKPLHFAAQAGHPAIVGYLLEHGAEISRALHETTYEGRVETARLLLKHGADINEKGSDEATPLERAVASGQAELVEFLLTRGANVNAQGLYGQTALHVAASRNDVPIGTILLKHGADPTLKSNDRPVRPRSEEFRKLIEQHRSSSGRPPAAPQSEPEGKTTRGIDQGALGGAQEGVTPPRATGRIIQPSE